MINSSTIDTSEKSITPASKDDNPTVLETAQQQLYLDNTDGMIHCNKHA